MDLVGADTGSGAKHHLACVARRRPAKRIALACEKAWPRLLRGEEGREIQRRRSRVADEMLGGFLVNSTAPNPDPAR